MKGIDLESEWMQSTQIEMVRRLSHMIQLSLKTIISDELELKLIFVLLIGEVE